MSFSQSGKCQHRPALLDSENDKRAVGGRQPKSGLSQKAKPKPSSSAEGGIARVYSGRGHPPTYRDKMGEKMHTLAADVTGRTLHEKIDASSIMMAAKNASCVRLSAMLSAGIEPDSVAVRVFGLRNTVEPSTLAVHHGNAFERVQCRGGAARLLNGLQEAGMLGEQDRRVLDLSQLPSSEASSLMARVESSQRAVAETERALRSKIAQSPDAPNLILQAHLLLPQASIRPDFLVARSDEPMYRVGEIKAAVALGHLTDERDIANAAAQCGVYGIALEASLRRLGSSEPVPTEAVLVLRKAGSLNGMAILQSIERDLEAARLVLDRRARSLQEVEQILGPGQTLDSKANVLRLPAKFSGTCRSFCPMWRVCLREARRQGAPAALGQEVDEIIGPLGNTQRARDLVAGAVPANDLERDIKRHLQACQKEFKEAAG